MRTPPIVRRLCLGLRYRLGLRVASPLLEAGDSGSLAEFYRSRVTHCGFLSDPAHYEYPRAQWLLQNIAGGDLLEIGCGDGGMTRLLAPRVNRVVALDISSPSLQALRSLAIPNVETVEQLVEDYQPARFFDRIVMSEVVEHLRQPEAVVGRCFGWLKPGGCLLVTTPNGHWESDEHLQEFDFATFSDVFVRSGAEQVTLAYLRDGAGRRRWLTAQVSAPSAPPAQDDFFNRAAIARARRPGQT